ncbi:MAG TPA: hypothetical protein VJY39_07925 [Acidisphaera sp.]|nr:hypothetical protein [Acidisphaera sp.]
MIVIDASTLVSAAIGRGSVPDRAVRHAFRSDLVVLSAVMRSFATSWSACADHDETNVSAIAVGK